MPAGVFGGGIRVNRLVFFMGHPSKWVGVFQPAAWGGNSRLEMFQSVVVSAALESQSSARLRGHGPREALARGRVRALRHGGDPDRVAGRLGCGKYCAISQRAGHRETGLRRRGARFASRALALSRRDCPRALVRGNGSRELLRARLT